MSITQKLKIDSSSTKKFEWTPARMTFWGFNIIAGYTFVIGLSQVFTGVGNWLPMLFIISAFVAFGSGLSFGRMACRFNKNGGTLLYVRRTFGRSASGFAGMYQLLQMPLLTASIPITTVWLFSALKTGSGHHLDKMWYIYVLGFLVLLVACMIPALGFTSSELTLYILWFFKWAVVILIFILAFIEIKSFPHNIFHNGYNPMTKKSAGSSVKVYEQLVTSLITFFFAFGGFEAVAAQTEDIKDGKSKIVSILLKMIMAVCVFYLFYYFFFLGALGASTSPSTPSLVSDNSSDPNPINNLLAVIFNKGTLILAGSGMIVLFVINVILQVLNKSSSRIQCGWGNAKIIASYAEVGFLPKVFYEKNKYNKRSWALGLDIAICLTFSLIFLGLSFGGKYLIFGVLDIISYISFMQYFIVTICCIVLHFKKSDKFKLATWELIYYLFIVTVIAVFVGSYTVIGFSNLHQYIIASSAEKADPQFKANLTVMIDVIMLTIIFVFALGFVFISKLFKWDKNEKNFSDIDKEIDKTFGHAGKNKENDDFAFKGF